MRVNKQLLTYALLLIAQDAGKGPANTDVLKTKHAPTKNQAKAARRKKK